MQIILLFCYLVFYKKYIYFFLTFIFSKYYFISANIILLFLTFIYFIKNDFVILFNVATLNFTYKPVVWV